MNLCDHMQKGAYPFETVLVLDDHLGPTDALVRCRRCGSAYLLEMLDWLADERLFRVRAADSDATSGLLRDLDRGSCDLQRAGEQARYFGLSSERLPVLILLNTRLGELSAIVTVPDTQTLPGASWRALPCDGSWFRQFALA